MARQNLRTNPEEKLFEAYTDFSGGHNSEASNERLKENEFPILENVDLSGRGAPKRRSGRKKVAAIPGNGQGMFFYYRLDQDKPDIIIAVSGKLYVIPNGSSTPTEVVIKDGGTTWTFQPTLSIEAVQYKSDMFIATGTKLVELTYDTSVTPSVWKASTVEPYKPTVMEAIYIGTNGLADNPDAYIQDGVATELQIAGIKPSKQTGVVNEKLSLTAFINKPASITSVDYKWEWKKTSATTWTLGKDWTTGFKMWPDFLPTEEGTYDVQVSARNTADATKSTLYVMSAYRVNLTENKTINNTLPNAGIQKCRKITLHWDRLLLSLDNLNPYQMYISDLMNPRYFPSTNTISFDAGKQEPITSVVKYRNYLIVFTRSTVQTLTGKSTDDYQRNLIHDGIGCISDRSAKVVGNNVIFHSQEGIQKLTPNQFQQETLNVSRIDENIKSEVLKDTKSCALVSDNMYWLCLPDKKVVFRYYYDNDIWVRDSSTKLNFAQMLNYGEDIYDLSLDGNLYKHDETVWSDDMEVYDMTAESKYLDLSFEFNNKKLKRLYILARHFAIANVQMFVSVFADSHLALSPDKGETTVDENGFVTWVNTTEPNFNFYSGTSFGSWIMGTSPFGDVQLSVQKAQVRGKCRRVKVRFVHRQDSPCEIYGFGLEYKTKKP